jgi:polysaccharide biosynthesis protein PslH
MMRTMHYARVLATLGEVDIMYVDGNESVTLPAEVSASLRLPTRAEKGVARRVFSGVFHGQPFPVLSFSAAARHMFRTTVLDRDYTYVLIRSGHLAGLARELPEQLNSRVLIDLDDDIAGSLYEQTIGSDLSSAHRKVFALNRSLLRRHIRRSIANRTCLVASGSETAKYGNGPRRVVVVPNVVPRSESFVGVRDGHANTSTLLFVGTLDYAPNVEGLRWFIDEVLPGLRAANPDLRLLVVGRNPSPAVVELCSAAPAVTLHANVPDVVPFYEQAGIVVAPILSGGGTRIKIIEAAFARRPVLSTRIGAEGLELVNGEEIFLADSPAEFVSIYKQLLNSDLYGEMAAAASQRVLREYSPERVAEIMRPLLAELASERTA